MSVPTAATGTLAITWDEGQGAWRLTADTLLVLLPPETAERMARHILGLPEPDGAGEDAGSEVGGEAAETGRD